MFDDIFAEETEKGTETYANVTKTGPDGVVRKVTIHATVGSLTENSAWVKAAALGCDLDETLPLSEEHKKDAKKRGLKFVTGKNGSRIASRVLGVSETSGKRSGKADAVEPSSNGVHE